MQKTTLVLGASDNETRYSNMAIKKLLAYHNDVIAVGRKIATVENITIQQQIDTNKKVDTITLYLSALNQVPYYQQILELNPRRIIFNPGAENEELAKLATNKGIEALEACTLVLLSTNQY